MTREAIETNTSAYQRWLRRAHMPAHARRTAGRNAAFLLPHLRPGMRLLDAGCGPGSITAGLAAAVAPGGAVTGIDANVEAIAAARALAPAPAPEDARFAMGDVYALPFAEATFDAVFSHAVMQHLRHPLEAMREMRRVMRPGGVIGVADADHDGSIIWPASAGADASLELMRELRARAGGGDPRVGKRLGTLLYEAGFTHIEVSVAAGCDGTAESTQRAGSFWSAYLRSPELRAQALALGLASDSELETMAHAWQAWGAAPGAMWARFWCQATAFAP